MTPAATLAALEGGGASAVRLALELWRQHRHPALAQWLVHLDAILDHTPEGTPRKKDAFHAFWMEHATVTDPLIVGWSARTVADRVPVVAERHAVFGLGGRYKALHARLDALARQEPDPRIAHHALQIAVDARYPAGWDPDNAIALYAPVFSVVSAMQDASVIPVLDGLIQRPNAGTNAVRHALTTLATTTKAELETFVFAPPAWLDPVRRWLPTPQRSEASTLLDQVRRNPGDLELRQVYADALLAEGDPRGQFIALQLHGDEASLLAAEPLLRKHQKEWLGPLLSRVLCKVRFADGFLDSAALESNARASRQEWEQAAEDPCLATLTSLELRRSNARNFVRFLVSPALVSLRRVRIPTRETFGPIARGPNAERLEHVILNFRPKRDDLIVLLERMPALATLVVKTTDRALPADFALLSGVGVLDRCAVSWMGCSQAACAAVGAAWEPTSLDYFAPMFS